MSGYGGYDPEAVYQDADILQAQYEDESRALAALHARGICTHGGTQGYPSGEDEYQREIRAALRANGVPEGGCICTEEGCGEIFASYGEHEAARAKALRS